MAIQYILLNQTNQKKGIEVLVEFTNGIITKQKLFLFKDQSDIDNNFDIRMQNTIDGYIADRERAITADEIVDRLIQYFQNNTTLTRAQAVSFMNEKIIVSGGL